MKDEWGFSPVHTQGAKDGGFWHSKRFATAHAKAGGGEFLDVCCDKARRTAAVNHYMVLFSTGTVRLVAGHTRYGHTGERRPLPVRTSLPHPMSKPVWYNPAVKPRLTSRQRVYLGSGQSGGLRLSAPPPE
jgi:hypothetical protein